jgi:hypothetical protein
MDERRLDELGPYREGTEEDRKRLLSAYVRAALPGAVWTVVPWNDGLGIELAMPDGRRASWQVEVSETVQKVLPITDDEPR